MSSVNSYYSRHLFILINQWLGAGGGGPPPPPPPASSHSSAGQPLVITENWREVVLVPSLPASIYFTSSLAGHTATPSSDLAWLTLDLEVSPSLTLLTPHLPPSHHSLLSWLSILSQVWPPPTTITPTSVSAHHYV